MITLNTLFLWETMESFGFNADFIAMIKLLYNDSESILNISGSLCAHFTVCRGVTRGRALSLEPLLCGLRLDMSVLTLPGFNDRFVISAYADDIIVFIKDQNDMDVLTNIVEKCFNVSSAKVNWQKSDALLAWRWDGPPPVQPQSLKWKTDGLKYLGIHLSNEHVLRKSWDGVLEKVSEKMAKW